METQPIVVRTSADGGSMPVRSKSGGNVDGQDNRALGRILTDLALDAIHP